MKKLLLTTAAFLAVVPAAFADSTYNTNSTYSTKTTTTAYAAPDTSTYASPVAGLYAGAYGGYDWTDVDTRAGVSPNVNGGDYGGFVGVKLDQYMQNNLGLTAALEGFYGGSSADDTDGGVSIKKNNEWGVNVRPGLSFLDVPGTAINPYGILGYRRTEFEASGAGTNSTRHYNGFDLGLGTELISWQNLGMRVDYTHTFYADKQGIDPDSNDIRVGVAYHFN